MIEGGNSHGGVDGRWWAREVKKNCVRWTMSEMEGGADRRQGQKGRKDADSKIVRAIEE
jgi:hypothetical protein